MKSRTRVILGITLIAIVAACSLLPDRVFVDAHQNPIGGTGWQDVVGGDDHLIGVGVEWDLKPTRVIIEGQREDHPWDVGSMLGIYDGTVDPKPQPLTVTDEDLHARIDALSEDLKSVRETSDMLKSILAWLTAGGGATIASFLGLRAVRKSREPEPHPET